MRNAPALFLLLALSACAKNNGTGGPPSAGVEERKALIAANGLVANAQSLAAGKFRSACDEAIEPGRQEMAAALEAHQGEIETYLRNHPANDNATYKTVPFGPTYVRERIVPIVVRPGWQEERYSWHEMLAEYNQIKNTPVDHRWADLNSDVRGTIVDDVDRAVGGWNYQIDENSQPALERLIRELSACDSVPTCVSPDFSPESLSFINSMVRVKRHYDLLQRGETDALKRENLHDFLEWERVDHRVFEFTPNPLVRMTSSGHYVLPLDPGPFAAAADQLRRYIEDVWHDDTHAVAVVTGPAEGAFRLELGDDPGGRSFVNRKLKTVNLNPNVRARSIAHEIGHVLGFSDYYFEIFDPATCDWRSRSRDDDLMSNSGKGSVLTSHWEEMAKQYK